jgi:hypothetical protein
LIDFLMEKEKNKRATAIATNKNPGQKKLVEAK